MDKIKLIYNTIKNWLLVPFRFSYKHRIFGALMLIAYGVMMNGPTIKLDGCQLIDQKSFLFGYSYSVKTDYDCISLIQKEELQAMTVRHKNEMEALLSKNKNTKDIAIINGATGVMQTAIGTKTLGKEYNERILHIITSLANAGVDKK